MSSRTDYAWPEYHYRKYETGELRPDGQPGFMTATGRVELFCSMFFNLGLDPMPLYEGIMVA